MKNNPCILLLQLKEDAPESVRNGLQKAITSCKGVATEMTSKCLEKLKSLSDGVLFGEITTYIAPYAMYNREFAFNLANRLFEIGFFLKKNENGELVKLDNAKEIEATNPEVLIYPSTELSADAGLLFGDWIEPRMMTREEEEENRRWQQESLAAFMSKAMSAAGIDGVVINDMPSAQCEATPDGSCPDCEGKAEPVETKEGVALQS